MGNNNGRNGNTGGKGRRDENSKPLAPPDAGRSYRVAKAYGDGGPSNLKLKEQQLTRYSQSGEVPNDPEEITFTTWEELQKDLHVDYSTFSDLLPFKPERAPKPDLGPDRPNGKVITDATQLPEGWSHEEPDLDPNDHDAQIERCYERLRKNYMNWIFEERKAFHLRKKREQQALMSAHPMREWEVVQRLQVLEGIRKHLTDTGDTANLQNVNAVIKAYKGGHLDWIPRLVTYWAKGKQLCQPRPFNWNEYELIHDNNDGYTAFWVESLDGLCPNTDLLYQAFGTKSTDQTAIDVTVWTKLDHNRPSFPFSFIDDTGATFMSLTEQDIETLRRWSKKASETNLPPPPRRIAYTSVRIGDGSLLHAGLVAIQLNIRHNGDFIAAKSFPDWPRVPCLVKTGVAMPRVLGPWLRSFLYTATVPTDADRRRIYYTNRWQDISQNLPRVDLDTFRPKIALASFLHPWNTVDPNY